MWENRVFPQMSLRQGLRDLYHWNNQLFDSLRVPERMDKNLLIDTLMQKLGNTPLTHPDPGYMQTQIGYWSTRKLSVWNKLLDTMEYEYNPIENTDRHTDWTDTTDRALDRKETGSLDRATSGSLDRDTTGTASGNAEDKVSADNSDSYQPDKSNTYSDTTGGTQKDLTEGTQSDATTGNLDEDEKTSRTYSEYTHGNIGTMTTQYLIEEQRRVVQFDPYEYIVEDFKSTFCMLVY